MTICSKQALGINYWVVYWHRSNIYFELRTHIIKYLLYLKKARVYYFRMKQNILDFFKIMNIIIYISFLQCFLGFEVYFNLLLVCLLLIALSSQMKKNDGILYSNQSPKKGLNLTKKKVNVIFIYIKVIFSNIFFKLLKKNPSTFIWKRVSNFSFHFNHQHLK